jgi:hypothetical protein
VQRLAALTLTLTLTSSLALSLAPSTASAIVARPNTAQRTAAAAARLAAAIRARDPAAIAEVLDASFTNNGMWFPDAACAKRFRGGGEIAGADVTAFARCLAQLKVQLSTRKAARDNGAVLTVDPGIEIELSFRGDRLRWIGFPSQTGDARAIPMLSAQALEALRTRGTTLLDDQLASALGLELTQQRSLVLTAWVKVCIAPTGAVTTSALASSSPATAEVFLRAISDWQFQPFKVRGAAMSACAAALLSYPGARAPAVETYPLTDAHGGVVRPIGDDDGADLGLIRAPPPPPPPPPTNVTPARLENLRTAGTPHIIPDAQLRRAIIAAGKAKLSASFKLCISDTGDISAVNMLTSSGFPAYDRQISAEMLRQWRYQPYKINGVAIPVCAVVTIAYDVSKPVP